MARLALLAPLLLMVLAATTATAAKQARGRGKPAYHVRIREAGTCAARKHHIVTEKLLILMDEYGSEYVTSHYHVNKLMKIISKFEIVFTRCRGAVTPSLCEYFMTWGWTTGLCDLVPAKNTFWSPLVQSITPPFKCPLATGSYYLANGSLNPHMLDLLLEPSGLEKFIWLVEIRIFDEEKVLNHCFNVTGEVHRVRRRH